MKVYTLIKFDMDTLAITEEESFEYSGPIVECGGGKQSTTTVDKEYNRRMAAISEKELGMAEEYFKFWQTDYKPFEAKQVAANTEMLPYLTEAEIARSKVEAATDQGLLKKDKDGNSLLGLQQENTRLQLQSSNSLIGKQSEVARAAYDQALRGVDVEGQVRTAQSDVAQSYAKSTGTLNRDLARTGAGTGSDQYTNAMSGLSRDRAKSMAGNMTAMRQHAENTNFDRLKSASQLELGKV